MGAILTSLIVGLRRPCKLFDLALDALELLGADPVELLAAFPELRQLVDTGVTALQPGNDLLQLRRRLFERHSTVAPKVPSATRTLIGSPVLTCEALRTTSSARRTIA